MIWARTQINLDSRYASINLNVYDHVDVSEDCNKSISLTIYEVDVYGSCLDGAVIGRLLPKSSPRLIQSQQLEQFADDLPNFNFCVILFAENGRTEEPWQHMDQITDLLSNLPQNLTFH